MPTAARQVNPSRANPARIVAHKLRLFWSMQSNAQTRCANFEPGRDLGTLRAFIDHSPAVAFLKNADGQMLYVNRTFEKTFQKPADQFLGKTDAELWPAEIAEQLRAHDRQVLATGQPLETIEHVPAPNGRLHTWLTFKFRVTAEQGDQYVGGMAVDITARVDAEKALNAERTLLRALIDNLPDLIYVKDRDGRLILSNAAHLRFLGAHRLEEVLGKTVFDCFPREVAERYHADERAVIERGESLYEREEPRADRTGITGWSATTKVPLRDAAGHITGMVGITRDITERKRAEEQIRATEARYRQLVEQLPAITYMAEFGSGRWLYCSPQIESLLGFTVAEWTGERCPWLDQIHPDDRPQVLAAEAQCRLSGKEFCAEYRLRARDGHVVWFSDHAVVEPGADGQPQYLHGVMFDITGRKALEEKLAQAQKMDAIGRLAGGVAHDFNNILTAILGYSELILRRADGNERIRDNAQEIQKAAERAASLTRQLLAFSRKQTLQPRVLDLNAVVAEMDKMLRRLITESIHLDVRLDPALWRARADPGQIQQVIMNLAVNARDAMPSGGTLTIETANVVLDEPYVRQHSDATAGEHVLLAITDTGYGLSAEVVEHLFEPFFTTKGLGQGTGLGLATCYGIVRQSGGHIGVYTEIGRGTTFKVYLPRATDTERVPVALLPAVGAPRGRERVLVVEDEEPVRELSAMLLRDLGYQVIEARDGEEALRLTKQAGADGFDLLFTDMVMPKMGGKELAYWFRLTHPSTRVLFTSGYPEKSISHNGELVAGIAFLHKPYTPDTLARKVREVLDN
jgi:two-component system cell cycle sensor histidine kinase/response regulator CckA